MMTADFSRGLPDLRAGVYRHYKGRYYLVLGYAHDANSDALQDLVPVLNDPAPSAEGLLRRVGVGYDGNGAPGKRERAVVVYVGLELDDTHKGPRLAVRTAEDFFALVCSACGNDWECPVCSPAAPIARFEYMGPSWYGWPRTDTDPSGTRPAPDTAAVPLDSPTGTERAQPWAPCNVRAPHEPHGPAKTIRCPGVPPRHPVNTTAPYGMRTE